MKIVLARFREFVTMSRVWRWWTIAKWKDAADVAFKFAAILGAIAAANFFVLKSETDWTVTYCLMLDPSIVREFYAENGQAIPSSVFGLDEALACDVDRLPSDTNSTVTFGGILTESSAQSFADALAFAAAPDFEISVPDEVEVLFRDRFELTGEFWDGRWIESLPAIAGRVLALHGDLAIDQLDQAINAVESAVYYRASLAVSNIGQATARGIEITEPDKWMLQEDSDSAFDLPAGVRREFVYIASKEFIDSQRLSDGVWSNAGPALFAYAYLPGLAPPTFYVTSESSEILDTNTLSRIGLALLTLWLIIVVKDIATLDQANSPRPRA